LEGNNPVFTIESLPAGTYIWSYAASIPDGCNGETEGEFVVLDQQAPVPNPLGCAGSFEPTERCTDNFIKFRTLTCPGQVFTPSKSGKYFEDLEGISLTRIADVTTEKYKGVADFVNSRLAVAIDLMMDELIVKLPDHRFKQAVRTHRFGWFKESQYEAISPKYRGQVLRKQYSPLSYFLIESVTLKANTTKLNHQIKIFEGSISNPVNLASYRADLIAGQEITVHVNHRSYGQKLFVLTDNTDVAMSTSFIEGCHSCHEETYGSYGYNYLIASGFDGVNHSGNTYGVRVDYSIRCDKELLFCKLAMECKNAVLYRAGVEILKEWLSGDRMTFVSIYSEDWAKAKLVEWTEMSDYYLNLNIDGLSEYLTDLDCLCLPCSGNRIGIVMP
jgi:hypothetical protein